MNACKDCRFYEQHNGECRQHPPQIRATTHNTGYWPAVCTTDWCGEFQPAPQPTEPSTNARPIPPFTDNGIFTDCDPDPRQ